MSAPFFPDDDDLPAVVRNAYPDPADRTRWREAVNGAVAKGISPGSAMATAWGLPRTTPAAPAQPRGRIAAKLSNMFLDEISLVDRPANPGATVLLFKRGTGPHAPSAPARVAAPPVVRKAATPPPATVTIADLDRLGAERFPGWDPASQRAMALELPEGRKMLAAITGDKRVLA